MKIACLLVGCALAATIANAQQPPIRATGVLRPAPAGQAASAGVTHASAAPRIAVTSSRLASVQAASSSSSSSGIVYTCDPTIIAVPGVCDTLNTTIAGLYASAFTNANASIYITFGTTALGESYAAHSLVNYGVFRNALQASGTDADDTTAFTDSVPAADPFTGSGQVLMTNANFRVLGFSPLYGYQPGGAVCTAGTAGCYDGIVIISNEMFLAGNLYFRTGTINPNQYDFYSAVEHETDEVLGTGSCIFGCLVSLPIAPPDLFRYQSNGARSFGAGNNNSCSIAAAGNACFSLDGVHMLQQYNNLDDGEDAGDWVPNCLRPLVQNSEACPGVANLDISPAAEIRVLDVIGYTLAPPVMVTTKLTSNTTGIVSGACSTPPAVANFTMASPAVYLYFSVNGANMGDTAQINFIRPDGVVYSAQNTPVVPSSGTFCFSNEIPIAGTAAASYPGIWSIQVFWDRSGTPLFTLNFTVSASSVTVTTPLTSNTTGVVNGVCGAPPAVSNFTAASPQVWLYFAVTGANVGDTARMTFLQPGGMVYTTVTSSPLASSGSFCFSQPMNISGTPAASFPGVWTIQVYWDNATTPLFTLNFDLGSSACTYVLDAGGAAFSAAGGSGNIAITTATGCAWSASGVPPWVTSATSGSGSGTLSYQVAANSGVDRSVTLTVAGVSYTVEQEAASIPGLSYIGSMPHIAAEENWTTTFTLVNKGTTPDTARLSFFNDPTGTLTLPLTFPQQPAATGALLAASIDQSVAANASLVVTTAGPQTPPVQQGSAQLSATGNVDGFAIFHLIPGAQEAVVPMETRNASSYILAFDNTNGVGLGVAVANVSVQAGNVGVILRDDTGTQIGTGSIAMQPNGHKSFVLSDPATGFPVTANKRGTIEFDTPAGGQISALGIRTTPLGNSNTLTTIPALANVGTTGGSIAHIATGNGWQTTFVLVNTGTAAASVNLNFFADATGASLTLPISFPQVSGTVTDASTVSQMLAGGATLLVESDAPASNPTPTTGSAQLTTSGNVSGFVIFRYNPNGQEAVVPLESRVANGFLIAFDNTNGTATGIAVNSVSTASVNVPVIVRDDAGNQLTTDTLSLNANGHLAFTLGSSQSGYKYPQTANLRGTIEFDTPAGAQVGALGIRIPAAHTFTTLPALAK
jgi:hypothetical protein